MSEGKKTDGGFYRNRAYKYLHTNNTLEEITDRRGNSVYLNLAKRIMLNRPYKNPEYEKERIRMMKKITDQAKENSVSAE